MILERHRLKICLWTFQTSQWNLTIGTRPSGLQISRIPQSIVNERCLGRFLKSIISWYFQGILKAPSDLAWRRVISTLKSLNKCYSSLLLHIQAVCPTSANWEFGSHIYSVSQHQVSVGLNSKISQQCPIKTESCSGIRNQTTLDFNVTNYSSSQLCRTLCFHHRPTSLGSVPGFQSLNFIVVIGFQCS